MQVKPQGTGELSLVRSEPVAKITELSFPPLVPSPVVSQADQIKITTGPLSSKVLEHVSLVESSSDDKLQGNTSQADALQTTAQSMAQLPQGDQAHLRAALSLLAQGQALEVTPEQQTLLQQHVPAALREHPQSLYEAVLIADVVQAVKASIYRNSALATMLMNQIHTVSSQIGLTEEQYKQKLSPASVKILHLEQLWNPELIPLLPRLNEALDGLRNTAIQSNYMAMAISSDLDAQGSQNPVLNQNFQAAESLKDKLRLHKRQLVTVNLNLSLAKRELVIIRESLQIPILSADERKRLSAEQAALETKIQKYGQEKQEIETDVARFEQEVGDKLKELTIDNKIINYYEMSVEQRKTFSSVTGHTGLMNTLDQMLLKHQAVIGSDLANYMKQALIKTSEPSTSAPPLNLNERINFTVVQMMRQSHRADIDTLQTVLEAMAHHQPIEPAWNEQLKHLGLFYQHGQLLNVAQTTETGQPNPLSDSELATLKDVTNTLLQILPKASEQLDTPNLDTMSGIDQVILGRLSSASDQLDETQQTRELVEKRIQALEEANVQLEQSNNRVDDLCQDVQQLSEQLQQREAILVRSHELLSKLKALGSPEAIKNYLLELSRQGQLSDVAAFLHQEFNLDIAVQGERVTLKIASQSQGSESLLPWLEQQIQVKQKSVNGLKQDLIRKQQALTHALQTLEQTKENVQTQKTQLSMAQEAYLKRLSGAQQSLDELRAIKNDPDVWRQLSPERQHQVEALIAQFEKEHQRHEPLSSRIKGVLTKTDLQLERARLSQLRTQALLEKLNAQFYDFIKALQALQATEDPALEDKIAELIAVADQLQAKLSLAPRPAHLKVLDLAKAWTDSLTEAFQACEKYQKSGQAAQAQAQAFSQTQVLQMKENFSYHLKQLKGLEQYRQDQVETMLARSLQQVKQQL